MKSEIKKLWVDALRSGEFEQGTGALRRVLPGNTDKYCCLGVLSELAYRAGVVGVGRTLESRGVTQYGNATAYLPPEVCEWAGISMEEDGDVDLRYEDGYEPATHLNDSVRLTFAQIADCIEATP